MSMPMGPIRKAELFFTILVSPWHHPLCCGFTNKKPSPDLVPGFSQRLLQLGQRKLEQGCQCAASMLQLIKGSSPFVVAHKQHSMARSTSWPSCPGLARTHQQALCPPSSLSKRLCKGCFPGVTPGNWDLLAKETATALRGSAASAVVSFHYFLVLITPGVCWGRMGLEETLSATGMRGKGQAIRILPLLCYTTQTLSSYCCTQWIRNPQPC